jgi:cytochrome c biogenesis protein CcdA
MKATHILLVFGVGFLLVIFAIGIYVVPKLQAGDSSTARQSDASRVPLSDVYVDITYATPEFVKRVKLEPYLEQWKNRAQPFLVGINTHVGTVAELEDLASKVQLEDSRGDRFPALNAPIVLSEHHNMYLLVFPLRDNYGKPIFAREREFFRLIVTGVGKTPERVFEWKLPVQQPQHARTLATTLMLALATVGALLVILSPCAIELTSYYAGIIAGIVSSSAAAAARRDPASSTPSVPAELAAHPAAVASVVNGPASGMGSVPLGAMHHSAASPRGDDEGGQVETSSLVNAGDARPKPRPRIPSELRGRIVRNLGAFVAGFTILYMASGATVALLGERLLLIQARLQQGTSLKDAICGPAEGLPKPQFTAGTASAAMKPKPGDHSTHGPGFGSWTRWANWLGASFLVYFALKSVGVLRRGGACFVWLGRLGARIRLGVAWLVGLASPRRAAIVRAPVMSMRRAENITPVNSFCAGLGLSVSCLTCMGGAILYPLLIFVGTSTWYWGAMILGTYSIALALPMAAIALAVGNYTWQFVHRPRLTRALQWTSCIVMITVAGLIAFDQTRVVNTVVFSILSAFGSNPDPGLAKL